MKMNEELRRRTQNFNEHREVQYVVHTPETVQRFADLTAQVVEQTEGVCLDMFMQIGMHGAILTRLMENASYEPRQEPIAEVRMNIPDDVMRNAMHSPARMRWDIPNLPEGFFNGPGRVEYACRVPADYQAYINTMESFVNSLAQRRVVTSQEPPDRWSGEYSRRFHLSVNREPLSEMSPIARVVTEALQNGIPLGETEPRSARMSFIQYNAGQGRIGTPAERSGYVLINQNDIYVVSTTGSFCMNENNQVTRAYAGIFEQLCFDCDRGISSYRLAEDLETALAEHDLNGRRVFFVGSTNRGDCDSTSTFPRAIEMLQSRGATVYATNEEANGLI